MPNDVPNELLYGRAGYLWACSFLNKHIGEGTIPLIYVFVASDYDLNLLCSTYIILWSSIAEDIITDGKRLARKGSYPLMYEWFGERYWGAAHGLAGIMHILMDVNLESEDMEHVKATLNYMIQNHFPSGNYPSVEGDDTDCLVHWCHGAPGLSLTLTKAAEVFQDKQFLQAAEEAAEVVWKRGLLKRVGICHGVSGNAYIFLSLYRLTGNVKYLYRAKAFTCFLLDEADKLVAEGKMHGGDNPYSLFEGQAGMAYLFLDMTKSSLSGFPAYEF